MKRLIIIPITILASICLLCGCKSKDPDKIDLTSIHTTEAITSEAIKETMVSTTAPTTIEETTASETEESTSSDTTIANISTHLDTYTTHGSSIQYPVVSNMADSTKQKTVNQLLKTNAAAILDSFHDTDINVTSSIDCKVISIDRKRITVVYTGFYRETDAGQSVNVFFTNTIDLNSMKNLGLNDYSDGYTMAGYIMSDDCKFYDVSPDLEKKLLDYRATQSLESYTALLEYADFSAMSADESSTLPQSFSYTHQGNLYFSIPVPHALGDYAIAVYHIDGK